MPSPFNKLPALNGEVIGPCTNWGVGFVPLKMLPCPHVSITMVPPFKTTSPPTTPTATGTLLSLMLFNTREPVSDVDGRELRRKIGVSVTSASMMASAPTPWLACVVPPVVKSNPTWQLLTGINCQTRFSEKEFGAAHS